MKGILVIILSVIILGIMVLLCFFSCILGKYADEYWENVRKELEEHDDKR